MTLPARTHYKGSIPISDEPLVCAFENFLSDKEIDHLIQAGKSSLQPAETVAESGAIERTGRSGTIAWVPQRHDVVIAVLTERICALVGLPLAHTEPLQLVHYTNSQGYAPHYDGWNPDTPGGKECLQRGGQRVLTCLLYLNDVVGSGGTVFPKLQLGVDARKGRMLLFHNCCKDTATLHPNSVHAGLPVKNGEKWVCNLWFRERAF